MRPRAASDGSRVLLTALALVFLALWPMYVLQPYALNWFFRGSIDRLLCQLWPAIVLGLACGSRRDRETMGCTSPCPDNPEYR